MWVLKKNLLGLALVVGAVCSSFAGEPTYSVDVYPFSFGAMDTTTQLEHWNRLMKYKLFATGLNDGTGIEFVGQSIFITDSVGYVGSAKGNFKMGGNTNHAIGGPILFGGSFLNGDGQDSILTGPTRFKGRFNPSSNGSGSNYFAGNYCFDGGYNENTNAGITKGNGSILDAAACASTDLVYAVDEDLDVPTPDFSSTALHRINAISGDGVKYIHVEPNPDGDSSSYNIVIPSITFNNNTKIHVVMPPGGRLTKIFVEGSISNFGSTANQEIVVVYAKGGTWNGTAWTGFTDSPLTNSDYAGNLLFYTPNNLSMGASQKTMQGTYICGGNIQFAQNTSFAGQLLAKSIKIDAFFAAKDFKYVPFNPPQIGLDMAVNQQLSEADVKVAGYSGSTLDIKLTKTPTTDVTFNYCFAFNGTDDSGSTLAKLNDVCTTSGQDGCSGYINLPICGTDTSSARILKGEKTTETPIKIWINDDALMEQREFFSLKIFNLTGGVFSDNSREWPVSMQILDDDTGTPCDIESANNSVTIPEDASIVLNGAFPAQCSDGTGTAFNVIITALPGKGSLTYQGKAVSVNQSIPSSGLGDLKFIPALNQNGSPYTTVKFKINDPVESWTTDAYTLTINVTPVNDAPIATGCDKTLDEGVAKTTPVCTVTASDVDATTKAAGEKYTLTYSIIYGNDGDALDVNGDAPFAINSTTGAITVNGVLDYERISFYPLLVQVTDGAANTVVPVNVTIADVNEAPVALNCTGTVAEDALLNTYTGCWINASDPEGTILKYEITGGTGKEKFSINAEGNIFTAAALDYETQSSYTLTITVKDKNGASGYKSTTATATITVTDVNEPPAAPADTCWIKENTKTPFYKKDGTTTKTCKVTGTDPEGKTLTYSITAGNTNTTFAISSSGVITASKAPNFEDVSDYTLVIDVSDGTNTTKTAVLVHVIDVNERPTAEVETNPSEVPENSSVNTYVTWVNASDIEDGLKLTYRIVAGNEDGAFTIKSSGVGQNDDGEIRVAKDIIDFETKSSYALTIRVCDLGTPGTAADTLCVDVVANITVKDGNEKPTITGIPDQVIDEHTPVGTPVGTVTGTDPEDGDLTFSFAGGNNGQAFAIDPTTGVITVARDIDFEALTDTVFKIKVLVVDDGGLRDETFVNIAIRDINEGAEIDDATMTVAENQPKGSTVGTLELFDQDTKNENRQNKFQAIGGDKDLFTIDATTGEIKTNAVFDYEAKTSYSLVVRVYDQDGNADTATVTINIADVKESSNIQVTYAETGSGAWSQTNPVGTLYVNENTMLLQWTADGKPMPDTLLENLYEGYNVVTLTYTDPTKNKGVTETVGIFVSTRTPEVTVTTSANHDNSASIYTLVETPAEGDTSVYVNKKNNDIVITVREPVIDETYSDSSCNYESHTFTVNTELEPVTIPSNTYNVMDKIAAAGPVLNDNPASEVTYSQYNKDQVKVSYTEKVAGVDVTISYVTDKDGNVEKIPVIGANGKIDSIEVITVSYQVNVGGKTVNVSYVADAITGQPLKTTTVNNTASNSGSSGNGGSGNANSGTGNTAPVYMYSLTEGEVLYSVTYDFTTKAKGMGETTVQVSYTVDQKGNVTKDKDGNVGYSVSYTYVNEMGNSSTQSVFIVVDLIPPKVKIMSPANDSVLHSNSVNVKWCVDFGDGRGCIEQDSLNVEGLQPGEVNEIVRLYRDKAGNEASDVVYVMAKNTKDVDISVEKPVTSITKEDVDKYYAAKEPEKGQTFAISIYNPQTDKEIETMVGGDFKNKEVTSGEEVYPGLKNHLGPTLGIQAKVPVINSVDGLATLDDLVGADGMILLDAVDAVGSKKVSVDEFVAEHCNADFKAELGSDISKANIYDTKMSAKIWVYTSLGQFVDYFSFTQELNDPSYASDAGVLTMYFEMKPDRNGDVHTANGRLYATGAYVYKTEITMKSKLRCDLPPFDDATNVNKMDQTKKVKEDLLKSFGYKRPKSGK